jgi:hypothetical protein
MIKGTIERTHASEIAPVEARSRSVERGTTPALQSPSGLTARGGAPPDATRRRATVSTMTAARAVVSLNQGASTSEPSLLDLFRMEDEQERGTLERSEGKRFDSESDKGSVLRAREDQDVAHATPSSPGPTTSPRPSVPAGPAAAQPAMREASGGTGETAPPGPTLTRSSHGRHRAGNSPMHAVAEQWQVERSRGSHMASSSAASAPAGVARSPRGGLGAESIQPAMADPLPTDALPATRAERKVRFGVPGEEMFAEQRAFYPKEEPKVLGNPEKVLFTSDEVVKARPKSLPGSTKRKALANAAVNKADEDARKEYVNQLGCALAHLQDLLALQNPERVQQAIQRGTLPAEVLGDRLDPQFVEDVLDIHTQFQAAARALGQPTFRDAGGIADIIDKALKGRAARAEALALIAELDATPSPPAPQALNANQIMTMTGALKGGGQALRRMSERAERANPKTLVSFMRRAVKTKPKPLEDARRTDFVALVDGDIAALVTKLRIEPQHAVDLLLRAVHAGQMGTDTLRPQDRELLLEVLAAKALSGGS